VRPKGFRKPVVYRFGDQKGLHHAEAHVIYPSLPPPQSHGPSARSAARAGHLSRPHGTAASREAYKRFVAEWSQNGGRLPAPAHAVTVTEVVVAYIEFATTYYRKDDQPTNEVQTVKAAVKIVRELYGRAPASAVGATCSVCW
jgi:hypothetical protein